MGMYIYVPQIDIYAHKYYSVFIKMYHGHLLVQVLQRACNDPSSGLISMQEISSKAFSHGMKYSYWNL